MGCFSSKKTEQHTEKAPKNKNQRALKNTDKKQIIEAKLDKVVSEKVKQELGQKKDPWELMNSISAKQETIELVNTSLNKLTVFDRLNYIMDQTKDLKKLILKQCMLKRMPTLTPNLVEIDLSNNQIQTIEAIDQLTCLEVLDLSHNKITSVHPIQSQLKELNLSRNQITFISPDLELPSLEILNLSSNELKELHVSLEKLPKLEILILNFNKIQKLLPSFFCEESSLYSLRLNNNPLVSLNSEISLLSNLRTLDLRSTKLTQLPKSLAQITQLESLSLSNNNFTFPPMDVVVKGTQEVLNYIAENETSEDFPVTEKDIIIENSETTTPEEPEQKAPTESFNIEAKNFLDEKSKPILERTNYQPAKQLLDYTSPLTSHILKLVSEENNPSKIVLSLQSIVALASQFLENYSDSFQPMEIPATSTYFIGRIGNYVGSTSILNLLGFYLYEKPFHGVYFRIKPKKGTKAQMKQTKSKLEEFISTFQECNLREQFTPDFEFFN